MDTLTFVMSSEDDKGVVYNKTLKTVEGDCITWEEAADSFFYFLRGNGYVIVHDTYANYVKKSVEELAEAERGEEINVFLPIDEV